MIRLPTVTVIIPTKNRPEMLSACVQSLARQDYPRGRWNAVVVNDGGAEPSRELVESIGGSSPFTWVTVPARGPAAARNRGARDSGADLLAFLDDDCRAEPNWLREMAGGLAATPCQACMGRTLNLFPDNRPAKAYQFFMEFYRDYARLPNGDLYLVMSNNAVYRREAFAALGGFHEGFALPGAEDLELSHRMAARGFRQGYLPQAVVRHANCRTARAYLRQQYQYGRGYARMSANLNRDGIPRNVGQRRRPQFHLALLGAMLRRGPGWRESGLIWCGILAHSAGMRSHLIRPRAGAPRPAGGSA